MARRAIFWRPHGAEIYLVELGDFLVLLPGSLRVDPSIRRAFHFRNGFFLPVAIKSPTRCSLPFAVKVRAATHS